MRRHARGADMVRVEAFDQPKACSGEKTPGPASGALANLGAVLAETERAVAAAPGSARAVRDAHRRLAGAVAAALAEPPAPASAPVTSTPVTVRLPPRGGAPAGGATNRGRSPSRPQGPIPPPARSSPPFHKGRRDRSSLSAAVGAGPTGSGKSAYRGEGPGAMGVPCGLARTAVASPWATPWSPLDELLDEGERPPLLPGRRAGSRMPGAPDNPYTCTRTREHVHESGLGPGDTWQGRERGLSCCPCRDPGRS